MKAIFVELPAFAKYRPDYLDDESFRDLQNSLMANPVAGDVIEGTGGAAEASTVRSTTRQGQAGRFARDLLLVGRKTAILVVYPV
jgi:hypothetical protein